MMKNGLEYLKNLTLEPTVERRESVISPYPHMDMQLPSF